MRIVVLIGTSLLIAASSSVAAERFVSVGAGVFDPWRGSPGHEIDASFLTTLGPIREVRMGAELAYRSAESRMLAVTGVDFDSYRLSFVAHYRPVLDWFVEPYLGGRITAAVNDADGKQIERARPTKEVRHSMNFGLGLATVLGVDVPLGRHVVFYAESSVGADVLWIDGHHAKRDPDDWDWGWLSKNADSSENVGGVTGTAGLRLRF